MTIHNFHIVFQTSFRLNGSHKLANRIYFWCFFRNVESKNCRDRDVHFYKIVVLKRVKLYLE